jgi:RimJ/RimL family protein N-acetyltransferase
MKLLQRLHCNLPITGRRIRLERLCPAHVEHLVDIFSNDEFWSTYRINQPRQLSKVELTNQLQFEYERFPGQVGKIEWLIFLHHNGKLTRSLPVGLASLSAYNAAKSQAEFMIGFFNKKEIKTGLGLETAMLILDFAFNRESLNNLQSYVYETNSSAQESTLALGFEYKGTTRHRVDFANRSVLINAFRNELSEKIFRDNNRLSRLSNRLLGKDITKLDKGVALQNMSQCESSFQLVR